MRKGILAKAAALLLTLAFVLAGCGNKAKEEWQTLKQDRTDGKENAAQQEDADTAEDDMASGKENTAAGEEDIPPEQMDLIKYNYYVELNNQLIEILNSIDYYYQVVEDAEEFSLLPDTGLTYGYRVYVIIRIPWKTVCFFQTWSPAMGMWTLWLKKWHSPLAL